MTRQGRRAATWYAYCWGRKRSCYGPAGPVNDHPDWTVRLSHPRTRIYGTAEGRQHPLKKVHIVREVIVATHAFADEVRWTHWLCGATTFEAALTSTPPRTVCAACLMRFQGRSVDPLP
jgi:hypothetical protein